VNFSAGQNPRASAIGDLDNDGKPDIVVANYNDNDISIIKNIAITGVIDASSFAPRVDFSTGANPYNVALGDINGDGAVDIGVANSESTTVSIFRNTLTIGTISSSSYSAATTLQVGTNPYSISFGDLDGDAKLDIATANLGSDNISVLRNLIRASLTLHVSPSGSDSNDGSAGSPLRNIQTALSMAQAGDVIKVAAGTYTQNLTGQEVTLLGGFDDTFQDANRNLFLNKTIIRPASGTAISDGGGSVIDGFIINGSGGATKGIVVTAGHSTITHNGIYGFFNSGGVGIQVASTASAIVKNNTVAHNELSGGGVILYAFYIQGNLNSATVVQNNIAYNNDVGISISPAGVLKGYNCSTSNTYGDFDGINGAATASDLNVDPVMVGPLSGDFRLKGLSPCIDAGNPADAFGDEPDPDGGRIDMGAYGGTSSATPSGSNPVTYVAISGSDTNDGSIGSPYRTIQKALNSALGTDVKVAAGTYNEALTTSSQVTLMGGYTATFAEVDRNILVNKTTIQGVSSVMYNDMNGSTIDGFIFDGNSVPTDAGIKVGPGSVVTHNVVIRVSASFAAGIEVNGGATVVNNTVRSCSYGIEIRSGSGAPVIKNNILSSNNFGMVTNAFNSTVRTYNNIHLGSFPYSGSDTNPGTGDLALDPQFKDVNVATLDLRILSTSPCVNAGDPADPAGDEPAPNGNRIDMGAYGGTPHTPYIVVTPAPEPTAQPTALTFSNLQSTGFTVSWTAAAGSPAGYIVLRKVASSPTDVPVDAASYIQGGTINTSTVAFVGSGTTFNESGLSMATTYFYDVFSYNGAGEAINYLTTAPLEGSKNTLAAEPPAQPTGIVISNVSFSSLTVSWSAASGSPSGYIVLRRVNTSPTDTPVDGTTYTVGTDIGSGRVVYVGSALTFNDSGLTGSTTYYYDVIAYNGAGNSINYLTTSPLEGLQTTDVPPADSTPPVFGTNNTPAAITPGTALNVSADFSDPESNVVNATLQYRSASSVTATFTDLAMVRGAGNTWTATVPSLSIGELGVEYRFSIENGAGLTAVSTAFLARIVHGTDGLAMTINTEHTKSRNNYRIIAIPLVLENNTVNSVFSDEFGAYDDKVWRMYHYNNASNPPLTKLNGNSTLVPGKGYWFLSSVPPSGPIDTGPGTTVVIPFSIPINSGWNQIGNPFNFDISWDDVLAANPSISSDLSAEVRIWNGSIRQVTELEKFTGGYIRNDGSSATLLIPAAKNPSVNGRVASREVRNPLGGSHWEVLLNLSNGESHYNLGGFGMHPDAKDEAERLDDYNLPRFFDYLEVRYPKVRYDMTVTRDMVPPQEEYVWTFTTETNQLGEAITLTWDNTYFGDGNQQLWLTEVESGKVWDMRRETVASVPFREVVAWKAAFGKLDFVTEATLPAESRIIQAYPNPFDVEISVNFAVSRAGEVTLEVLDINGRPAGSLVNGYMDKGRYAAVWKVGDRVPVPAGLYILRLRAGTVDHLRIIKR
jgi:parallel beta-helix repeat protein